MSKSVFSRYRQAISFAVLVLFLLQQSSVFASQVSTADMLNSLDQQTPFYSLQQRQQLQQSLIQKLRDAGVANDDLEQRVSALSDQDLHNLQSDFDQEAAGGDILGTAVFIFIVLLITDILGYTDIFPFVVKHPRHRHPRALIPSAMDINH